MVISNSYVSLPDGMFYDKSFMIVFFGHTPKREQINQYWERLAIQSI